MNGDPGEKEGASVWAFEGPDVVLFLDLALVTLVCSLCDNSCVISILLSIT